MRTIRNDECDSFDEVRKLAQELFNNQELMDAKICQLDSKVTKMEGNAFVEKVKKIKAKDGIARRSLLAALCFFVMLLVTVVYAADQWKITYDNVSNPETLTKLLENRFSQLDSSWLLLTPTDTEPTAAEGKMYFDDSDNAIRLYANGAWVTLAANTGNSLGVAYGLGSAITADTLAITITTTDSANNEALAIVHGETGNYSAMSITNASAYPAIQITGSSTGDDITGTSGLWTVSEAGVGTFAGLIVGATDIVMENGDKIDNGTNDTFLFTTGDEDLKLDLATGTNYLTLSSSTGLNTVDFGAINSIIGLTTITGDAADFTISTTGDATGEDLILQQAGSGDNQVQILSAGTATNAIELASSAGGITVTAVDDIIITVTSGSAGEDILITQTGAADASITLTSAGTGGDAIGLITSAGGIDITVAGAAAGEDLDLTADSSINIISSEAAADDGIVISAAGAASGIQITSLADIDLATTGAAGEDISLINTGGSIILQATEAVEDAIVLNASTAAGGIDITSNADIDITTTGASGEDISLVNTGGSIILQATESAVDSVKIESTAGGIQIYASGAAATEDIDIVATGSSINLSSTENAAAAIKLLTNGGTSETITVTNTQGTAAGAIALLSSAGGITLNAVGASAGDISFTAGDDLTITTTGDLALSISGNVTGNIPRVTQQYVQTVAYAKLGASGAGWVIGAADSVCLATLPASQTSKNIVIPITIPLKIGWTITAFTINGQIDSGGNTATLDADLRKHTEATAGYTDASIGAITQISKTADYKIIDSKGSLAEVVAADESYYILVTGTTAGTTDIEIASITVTVSEI